MEHEYLDDGDYVYDGIYDDEYLWNERLYSEFGDYGRPRQTIPMLFTNCLVPALSDGWIVVYKLLAYCAILRFTSLLAFIPSWFVHATSCGLGILTLYQNFEYLGLYIVFLAASSYLILVISQHTKYHALIISCYCVAVILCCELFLIDAKEWHKIRGIQMVLAMKIISVAFDLHSPTIPTVPSIAEYFGYTLCVGTLMFGPWISYNDYHSITAKNPVNLKWIINLVVAIISCFIFLSISTCWSSWLIEDDNWKWLTAYRDALSFRTSHYFVTFLSQATMLAVGITSKSLYVAKPQYIEVPRSLVEVVVNWHIPMHQWLKNYVFKVAKPYGTFIAVIATYAISALLHGLNFQLAAVLLSLGFFSYTEHVLRTKWSQAFNACILARSCRSDCKHFYKWNHPVTFLINLGFGILSIFNLAYLGVMFDSSSQNAEEGYGMSHILSKWSELSFFSHWLQLCMFVIAVLI